MKKLTHKEKDMLVLKHNSEILAEYIASCDVKKAETMVELLCLQIKIYLGHEVICTVNKDSLCSK